MPTDSARPQIASRRTALQLLNLLLAALLGGAFAMLVVRPWRQQSVVDSYHQIYYDSDVWKQTTWLGIETQKYPSDLFVYQEILFQLKPDLLIETGTLKGGSALYFASIMDLLSKGRVITVDIQDLPGRPSHPRITYVAGSSTSPETMQRIKDSIAPGQVVMVTLDSDHSAAHVARELELYAPLVTVGSYLVVEDTLIGHPLRVSEYQNRPGPMDALLPFLRQHPEFEVDRSREKFLVTVAPNGWLRRTR